MEEDVKRKRGRPRKDVAANDRCEIRLTRADREKLEQVMRDTGRSKTDIFRKGLDMAYNIASVNPDLLFDQD